VIIAQRPQRFLKPLGLATGYGARILLRLATLSIAAFILVGLILLLFVNEKKAREASQTSV